MKALQEWAGWGGVFLSGAAVVFFWDTNRPAAYWAVLSAIWAFAYVTKE